MKPVFYKLRQPSEAKVIGVKDGSSQAEFLRDGFTNKKHYDEIIEYTSLKNQHNFGKFPEFEINLEYVKMRKGARLTDFLSFQPYIPFAEYLISDKVVQILSTFNVSNYRLYPATIYLNDDVIKDYKLFFTSPMELQHLIEIKKSLFFDGSEFNPTSFFTFKTIEEYLNYIKDNFIGEKKLFFNETFDKTLDYFKLRGAEPFISKDLKETFEIAGVTGIKFMEATEPELAFED